MSTTLAAAPLGTRIGFTSTSDGDRQLALTVLPKPWRTGGSRTLVAPPWPTGQHRSLELHETDVLHVPGNDAKIQSLFDRCLKVAQAMNASPSQESALIVPRVKPNLANARPISEEATGSSTDLLSLFERLDLLFPRTEDLFGARLFSPLHRPILYRRMLDEIFGLAGSARRGYRSKVSSGGVLRGKIHTDSIVRYSMSGDPRLICTYDELTESTILLGIVCTALDQIAEARFRSPFTRRHSAVELGRDAVRLRRVLAEVTSLPVSSALLAGRRLRLPRLDQPWALALQMSLAVLEASEVGPAQSASRIAQPVELSVDTSALWERIVNEVFRRAGFHDLLSQDTQPRGTTSDPWIRQGGPSWGTRPDNVGTRDGRLWVIDAKYKQLAAGASPSRDDQYQMFAYSHLVELGASRPGWVCLAYPGAGAPEILLRGRDDAETGCLMLILRVPFPSPTDARTRKSWQDYLNRASATVSTDIAEAEALISSTR